MTDYQSDIPQDSGVPLPERRAPVPPDLFINNPGQTSPGSIVPSEQSANHIAIDTDVRAVYDSRPVNGYDFLVRGTINYPENNPVPPPP